MTFCSKCGTQLSENSRFCNLCGANQVIASSPPKLQELKSEGVALVLSVLLGPLGAGYMYLGNIKRGLAILVLTSLLWTWLIYTIVISISLPGMYRRELEGLKFAFSFLQIIFIIIIGGYLRWLRGIFSKKFMKIGMYCLIGSLLPLIWILLLQTESWYKFQKGAEVPLFLQITALLFCYFAIWIWQLFDIKKLVRYWNTTVSQGKEPPW